jgi:RNA recognition motif-containing protein
VGRKLYVGNLPFSATEEDITAKFSACGTVESAKLINDRDTGRSKGFGFVEMSSDAEAQAAIDKLNGQDYGGRPMTVNEARPQQKKGPRPGGGGGYAAVAVAATAAAGRRWRLRRRWRQSLLAGRRPHGSNERGHLFGVARVFLG